MGKMHGYRPLIYRSLAPSSIVETIMWHPEARILVTYTYYRGSWKRWDRVGSQLACPWPECVSMVLSFLRVHLSRVAVKGEHMETIFRNTDRVFKPKATAEDFI